MVGIDCHDPSTCVLKKTKLVIVIDWLDESIHAQKESVLVFARDYPSRLTNVAL